MSTLLLRRTAGGLAALLLAACAHGGSMPPSGVQRPPVDHMIEPPEVVGDRLEPIGLTHLLRGLHFIHSGHAGAAIPHLRLALIYDSDSAFIHERLSGAWSVAGDADEARRALEAGLRKQPEDAWLNWLAGELAVAERRYAEAVPHLRLALVEDATVLGAGPALVEALLWQSHIAEAEATATTLLARRPGDAPLALRLAVHLEDHGRLDQALAAYRRARVARPADRRAAFGEVRVLTLRGDTVEAADRLVPLFGFFPDEPQLYVQMTRLAVRAGRSDADAYRAEALRLAERDAFARSVIAAGDLLEGRVDLGIELLRQTLTGEPGNVEVRLYLAEVLFQHGQLDACDEVLAAADVDDPRLHRPRAWCLAASGRLEEAVTALGRAVQTAPTVRAVASDAARLLARVVEESRARQLIERIVDAGGERVDDQARWLTLATLVDQYGHGEEALELAEKALLQTPDAPDLLMQVSDLQARYGRLPESIATLQRLYDERPDDPVRLNALGFTLADAGVRLEEAEVWLRRAVRLSPDDGYIIDSLGWLLFRRGKLAQALYLLEWAARAAPRDPEILRHVGDSRQKLGKFAAARRAYEQALQSWPSPTLRRLIEARLLEIPRS